MLRVLHHLPVRTMLAGCCREEQGVSAPAFVSLRTLAV